MVCHQQGLDCMHQGNTRRWDKGGDTAKKPGSGVSRGLSRWDDPVKLAPHLVVATVGASNSHHCCVLNDIFY